MRFLLPVIANLLLLVAAFGLGSLIRPLIPHNVSKLDRLAIIPLAGFGLQGVLLFLLGIIRFSLLSFLPFYCQPQCWAAIVCYKKCEGRPFPQG